MKKLSEISLTEDARSSLEGACMDNGLALEALAQKNYVAAKAILERQNAELEKLVAAFLE